MSMEQKKAPFEISAVTAAGLTMDYIRFGQGERALVILPGISVQSVIGAADAVAAAYESLTRDLTIYLLDRRCDMPKPYPITEMARDTAEAIRGLGLRKVSIFGASQGGGIAMAVAAEHPELVDKLVLGSTSASASAQSDRCFEEWAALAGERDALGLYLSFGRAAYPEGVFEQSKELLAEASQSVTDSDLSRFIIMAEASKGFEYLQELERITCPVLVIGDRSDRVFGSRPSEEIAAKLVNSPKVLLHLYDGFGHAAYDTAPDYKERILSFLLDG